MIAKWASRIWGWSRWTADLGYLWNLRNLGDLRHVAGCIWCTNRLRKDLVAVLLRAMSCEERAQRLDNFKAFYSVVRRASKE